MEKEGAYVEKGQTGGCSGGGASCRRTSAWGGGQGSCWRLVVDGWMGETWGRWVARRRGEEAGLVWVRGGLCSVLVSDSHPVPNSWTAGQAYATGSPTSRTLGGELQ